MTTESAQSQARCVECQQPVAHPDDDLCRACGERIAAAKAKPRTTIDAMVPCHLPKWFDAAGVCEHPDHDA